MKRFEPQYLDPKDYEEEVEVAKEIRGLLDNKKYFKAYFKLFRVVLQEVASWTGWGNIKEELKDTIKEKFSFRDKRR